MDGREKAYVWVFNGGGAFPSGVFSSRDNAEVWIGRHGLTGCLTKYPLDQGAFEWAIETGDLKIQRDSQLTAAFIGGFACGREHYHYESGQQPGLSPEGAEAS